MFGLMSAKDAVFNIMKKDMVFVDLRSREEFEKGHIGRAFCLTLEQIEAKDYYLSKEYRYILYCNHGGVSMQAAALIADGEVPVFSLVGGFSEYEIFMRSLVDRKQGKL